MMAKTEFAHGTAITPEVMNALNNPRYVDDPQEDGEIPFPLIDLSRLPDVALELGAHAARLDKSASFYQYFIANSQSVAMTLSPQSILETEVLPVGSYVVSGQAVAYLPAGGLANMKFRAGVSTIQNDLADPSFGNYLEWDGVMSYRMIALPVTRRVISLSSPGKIYLSALCTNFGTVISGDWVGSLLAIPLPIA